MWEELPITLTESLPPRLLCSQMKYGKFARSTWVPLPVRPTKILPGNFLLAEVADRGSGLIPFRSLKPVYRFNLAYGVQKHGFSLTSNAPRERVDKKVDKRQKRDDSASECVPSLPYSYEEA